MRYLCLIYTDEAEVVGLSPSEFAAVERECMTYEDELTSNGQLLAVEALQPVHTATTVRVRHGKPSISDGPFAETKEQLAGFYLIDARDLNDAIRIASKIPPARFGCIEVRPIRPLETGPRREVQPDPENRSVTEPVRVR
jgi:hypothetical protein